MQLRSKHLGIIFFVLVFVTPIFFSSIAQANPGANKEGFSFLAGLELGIGTQYSTEKDVASRDMSYLGTYLFPGWGFGMITPGFLIDYRMVYQRTNPTEVSDTNTKGSGYVVGLGVNFGFESFSFLLHYDLMGTYALDKKTQGGQESKYTTPTGFGLIASYWMWQDISIDLRYRSIGYTKSEVGGTEADIDTNKFNDDSYGIGVSYWFL